MFLFWWKEVRSQVWCAYTFLRRQSNPPVRTHSRLETSVALGIREQKHKCLHLCPVLGICLGRVNIVVSPVGTTTLEENVETLDWTTTDVFFTPSSHPEVTKHYQTSYFLWNATQRAPLANEKTTIWQERTVLWLLTPALTFACFFLGGGPWDSNISIYLRSFAFISTWALV